jgi:hypothetical protein
MRSDLERRLVANDRDELPKAVAHLSGDKLRNEGLGASSDFEQQAKRRRPKKLSLISSSQL